MKKTILTSITAIAICCPAIAANDIASNASSAACTESVLDTTSGTSNLQAKWTANTLNIDWYNGDTKLTSNTCTYDSGITVPATDPTKTGYTFDGWTVRAVNIFANLDVSISNPYSYYARGLGGKGCSKRSSSSNTFGATSCDTAAFADLENLGDWKVTFSYGTVYGISMCSYTRGILYDEGVPDNNSADGLHCWCKLSEYTPNNGSMQTTSDAKWFYVNSWSAVHNKCSSNCADSCAYYLVFKETLRIKQYGQAKYVDDCSVTTNQSNCRVSFQKDYDEQCKWDGSSCYNYKVGSCSTLNNETSCNRSANGTTGGSCKWLGSTCYDTRVEDCSIITDETRCKFSYNSVQYEDCQWSGSVCHNYYVDDCSTIQDEAVCNGTRKDEYNACGWNGSSCYEYWDD